MKTIKIFMVLIATFLLIPFTVLADDKNNNETNQESTEKTNVKDKEVKIYFFRGEGCPHCAEAESFFKSIENEYGSLFEVIDYETYNNFDNRKLLDEIGELRDEDVSGVPYILIGSKSWSGYGSDYNEAIINAIKSEYDKDINDRYDIMKLVNKPKGPKSYKNDVLITILLLLICVGIGLGFNIVRKNIK